MTNSLSWERSGPSRFTHSSFFQLSNEVRAELQLAFFMPRPTTLQTCSLVHFAVLRLGFRVDRSWWTGQTFVQRCLM